MLELSPGIHALGGIKWELLVCLIAAWLIIFLCLCKGVQSLGKVVYVTATAPYVFLTILLIRGLLLPGAAEGIKYYITPDFSRLKEFKVSIHGNHHNVFLCFILGIRAVIALSECVSQ